MTRRLALLLLAPVLLAPAGAATNKDPVAGSQCIDLDQVVRQEPAGPNAITFTLTRNRVYRNTLANECPRLSELNGFRTIVWDNRGGRRVCRGDRFRLIEPTQARAVGVSGFPFCRLGAFTQVSR